MTKRFLGDHPNIKLAGMSPSHNWWDAWSLQRIYYPLNKIVLDKRTLYIKYLQNILENFKSHVKIVLLLRDPRDQLLSLLDFDYHRNLPRDASFFAEWEKIYVNAIKKLKNYQKTTCSWLLRYEDMVLHPKETKRHFLEWINLPVKKISAKYETKIDEYARGENNPPEAPSAHATNKIHQNSIKKWTRLPLGTKKHKLVKKYDNYKMTRKLMNWLEYTSPKNERNLSTQKDMLTTAPV